MLRTCSVTIVSDFPEEPTAEAGGEDDSVLANNAPALRAAEASTAPTTLPAVSVASCPDRAAMSTSFPRVAGTTVRFHRKIGRGEQGGWVMTTKSSAPARSSATLAQALSPTDREGFELRGINHLALDCRVMARTVDFYSNVRGMPLGQGDVNDDLAPDQAAPAATP